MDLKINEGITNSQIDELINYSNTDKLIRKTTNDAERFKNKTAAKKWLEKNRSIYTLVNENNKLQGIIWFGKKISPDKNLKHDTTFSIRLYGDARGKGLAKPFIKEAVKRYKKTIDYKENPAKGYWLVTNSDNLPAIKTYQYFGFEKISYKEKDGRFLMIANSL